MMALSIILISVHAVILLVWLSRHLELSRERRAGFTLTEDYPIRLKERPLVSVLVAAKDEEANIERCVRTILEQDYDNFEVIVCNDRSADRTGQIVERLAAEDPRLRLIHVTDLPAGWCGKNNAMRVGIAQARGEWICMVDADCHQTSRRTSRWPCSAPWTAGPT